MSNSIAIGVAYQDQAISGGTIDNTPIGATTPSTAVFTTTFASEQIGYSAAGQGTVTQATSKTTGVTINKSAGQITMNAASLNSNTSVSFTVTNSLVSAKDTIILNIGGGTTTAATYNAWVDTLTAGSFIVTLRNISGGALGEAVVLNFCVIHGQ
jgi:hypothetical protein